MLIRVSLLVDLGALNFEYAEVKRQTEQIRTQNMIMRNFILRISSLDYINKRARQQGFIDSTGIYRIR